MYWLASYPKSGNTWLRLFLGCLESNEQAESQKVSPLDKIKQTPIASSRFMLDEALGYSSSDLTSKQVESLRPLADEYWARKNENWRYRKVHDAYNYLSNGQPLLFNQAVEGAIYIVRNPLDVCISLAHYLGHKDIDMSIEQMADSQFVFCNSTTDQNVQLQQLLRNWSEHVSSWATARDFPVHIVRYEDMLQFPSTTFRAIVDFLKLPYSQADIDSSIASCSFEKLQKAEQEYGFKERCNSSSPFFREGKSDEWKNILSKEQYQRVVAVHHCIMKQFGYLL